jgi:hypothetical protein
MIRFGLEILRKCCSFVVYFVFNKFKIHPQSEENKVARVTDSNAMDAMTTPCGENVSKRKKIESFLELNSFS